MTHSYPYLYRFFQSLSITVLVLAVVALFFPSFSTPVLIGFTIYSAIIILFWELCQNTRYKKEILIITALILLLFVFLIYRKREWFLEVYETYQRELFLTLLVLPFTFLLSVFREKLYLLSGICLVFLIYAAVQEIPLHRMGGVAAFGFIFLSFIEIGGKHLYKQEFSQKLSGLVIFPLSMAILLSVLPVSSEPYPFTGLKNAWYQLKEQAYVLYTEFSLFASGQSDDFFVHFAGYDEKGSIGGSLLNSDKPALTVFVPGSLRGNLYLTGNIQNHYENNEWSFVDESEEDNSLQHELAMDYLELLYALYETDNLDNSYAYIWRISATVTYNGLYTKDMFFPLKLYEFRQIDEYSSLSNKFTAAHPLKEGDSYQFQYMAVNYGSKALESLIKAREGKVYETAITDNSDFTAKIFRSCPTIRNEIPQEGFEALLAERERNIYDNYMQIPDYLQEKITALTAQVTADADSDYEKLQAIEEYLQEFTYTKSPADYDGDAVEQFLFETQEGYCTYFASAFVLMSRAAGIPSRYVNGFCVPNYAEQKREFVVASDCAHAWPEAYITGIGWISFEPTSGYSQYHDTPWNYVPASQSTTPETETDITEPDIEESVTEPETTESEDNKTQISQELTNSMTMIISIIAVLIPVVIILFCILRYYNRKKMYLRGTDSQKLAGLMYYELSLLRRLGLKREATETLRQYEQRVIKQYPALEKAGFHTVTESYMQSFYGMAEPEAAALETAVCCVRETERYYKGIYKLWIIFLRLQSINERI